MKNNITLSGLNPSDFQQSIDGKAVGLFTLANAQMEVCITNYGGIIVSLLTLDREGKAVDVVTGHDTLDDYRATEEPYFGAICGRYANRIAKGRFVLDGVTYDELACNNGPNSLHGGVEGFNVKVWDVVEASGEKLVLSYTSADGEEGFPGEMTTTVAYQLTKDNELVIDYSAVTDKPTVLNLTNHSYFNLSGAGCPTVHDHQLVINASAYLPTDETCIPLGEPAMVEGTPMDFRESHAVGDRINDDFEALRIGRGYDHNYVLQKDQEGDLGFCARCISPVTGVMMDVYTTEPGVQLYTGNWMTGNLVGKKGQRYPAQSALCLETQHYPDSPNQPAYPTTVLRPGEKFESKTIFKFGVSE